NALLSARLDRLAPGERHALEAASVVGKVFWPGAVAELAPAEVRPSVPDHLIALARKQLLIPEAETFGGEEGLRFRHILVQDAAYRGIPKATRAVQHERFAGWLEQTAGERALEYEEIVGYHLERAAT